jgi:hypothetical protein
MSDVPFRAPVVSGCSSRRSTCYGNYAENCRHMKDFEYFTWLGMETRRLFVMRCKEG